MACLTSFSIQYLESKELQHIIQRQAFPGSADIFTPNSLTSQEQTWLTVYTYLDFITFIYVFIVACRWWKPHIVEWYLSLWLPAANKNTGNDLNTFTFFLRNTEVRTALKIHSLHVFTVLQSFCARTSESCSYLYCFEIFQLFLQFIATGFTPTSKCRLKNFLTLLNFYFKKSVSSFRLYLTSNPDYV